MASNRLRKYSLELIRWAEAKKVLMVFFCLFSGMLSRGQYYSTGQDPSQIRWKQINTENFQIIYPQEFESKAQKLASIFENVYDYGSNTLHFKPRKVSIVLHTRSAISNGLLAWAPKRIELFTTPNQQIYSQNWLEQLAIHEFRHLVQMDKIQSELPLLFKVLLGEQAAAAVTGLYLPYWFLEGDAVVTETALSNSGRGRTADFSVAYRAQLLEKGKYSYDKAYMGSYKDFVTDYYKLGYWMVGETRARYGVGIWSDALTKVGSEPLSITPLNSTLRNTSKLNVKQVYNQIFSNLTEKWKKDLNREVFDSLTILSPSQKNYTEYLYPQIYHDSLIFAYKTAIDDIGRFVLIYPDKSEKIIFTPGRIFDESVSLTGNLLIWAERRADLRWVHAERSVVQTYNVETKSTKEYRMEENLFSPTVSPDMNEFAAVAVDQSGNYSVGIYSTVTGALIKRFSTPDNQYFFNPSWSENGKEIYLVTLSSKGKCLTSIDMDKGIFYDLTERTFANLKNPIKKEESIFFSGDFSGKENIYSLNLKSKAISKIVSVPFGASYPELTPTNKLVFSNYKSTGFQIAAIALPKPDQERTITSIQLKPDSLATSLAKQELGTPEFDGNQSTVYQPKRYSKIGHLFNFHSWSPAYIDINNYEIRPGASLFSQNKLGTAETKIGYEYDVASQTGKYKLGFSYLGWFPEITTELIVEKEASNYYLIRNVLNQNNQIIASDTVRQRYTWNAQDAYLNIRLPFNFSKGKYTRMLAPEVQYSVINISGTDYKLKKLYPHGYQAMTYRLYGSNLLSQSSQNLMPRWGQQLDLIFRHSVSENNDLGTIIGLQSVFFFPGFSRNDGIRLYQGFQEKTVPATGYSFSNFIRFPRGYSALQANRIHSQSVDYKFPLLYPDISLGKLAYIKRLKASVFYDYAWLSMPIIDRDGSVYPNQLTAKMKSVGIELTSDLHVLRFFAPIELGVRTSYLPDSKNVYFDILLLIDFRGF